MSQLPALICLLGTALALTIAIEVTAACLLFGLRTRRELLVVALAQVVTNPAVELTSLAVRWHPLLPIASLPWCMVIGAELAALTIEALLYRITEVSERPWLLAATLNALSFGLGLALFAVR